MRPLALCFYAGCQAALACHLWEGLSGVGEWVRTGITADFVLMSLACLGWMVRL